MTTFLLIRHGLTDAVGHLMTGHNAGVHLNPTGRDQAASLPGRLGQFPIGAIYASPLERTTQTAQPIADARGLRVDVDPRLIEVDFGGWTGRRFADWRTIPIGSLQHGPQRDAAARRRIAARRPSARRGGGDGHVRRHVNENVVIVLHGDVLRAILLYFLGMPIDFVLRLELGRLHQRAASRPGRATSAASKRR